jgi:hypothetical protein
MLARRVPGRFDTALAAHGLTIGQFGLLMNLRRIDGMLGEDACRALDRQLDSALAALSF